MHQRFDSTEKVVHDEQGRASRWASGLQGASHHPAVLVPSILSARTGTANKMRGGFDNIESVVHKEAEATRQMSHRSVCQARLRCCRIADDASRMALPCQVCRPPS